ncbi:MAG: hypothetical protein KF696_02450 [Planctomycetes bacterium]|nr:hypothetical protein [Planctomycetota bacterium]MCW8134863.1 hypothetical protein [Planctomycetota bacterium]
MSLVELGVATFIVTVVALAGVAYYANARSQEIREWHEQNALFMAEREVESWRGPGYNALAGWTTGDAGAGNFLPYGYSFISPDPEWNQGGRFKPVTLDGFNYRIRARLLYNDPVGAAVNDFRVHEVWDNGTGDVDYWYRQIVIVVQWGDFSSAAGTLEMQQETRVAR